MAFFTREYQRFFQELTNNNTKTWFDQNRKRFEEHVKQPFAGFVEVMIALIRAGDPEIGIAAKDAIFRINRDTRFSKEKSPYKTFMAANISREGKKSKEWPGFYFQFSHDQVVLGGGAYVVEPQVLNKIRNAIVSDLPLFEQLVTNRDFTSKFGSLQGEKNKVLPAEFKEWVANEPLVANKQFYYMTNLDPSVLFENNLQDVLLSFYQAARDINEFLKLAITSSDAIKSQG